jgi:hypothetical protein
METKQLQDLKEVIIKANPYPKDNIYLGCSYKGTDDHRHDDKCRILIDHSPIQLQHVLIAINKSEDKGAYLISSAGRFAYFKVADSIGKTIKILNVGWDLTKKYDEQSEETKMWLYNLLCQK